MSLLFVSVIAPMGSLKARLVVHKPYLRGFIGFSIAYFILFSPSSSFIFFFLLLLPPFSFFFFFFLPLVPPPTPFFSLLFLFFVFVFWLLFFAVVERRGWGEENYKDFITGDSSIMRLVNSIVDCTAALLKYSPTFMITLSWTWNTLLYEVVAEWFSVTFALGHRNLKNKIVCLGKRP